MGDIKFDICMCLAVCLGHISFETAEWTWLRFTTGMEVCHGQCILHFGGECPGGPARGAKMYHLGDIVSVLDGSTC